MKIMVAVKRVIDPYVKIRVKTDGSGVETQNMKMAMNPFDEIAVEAALRLKEQGKAEEVLLVTVGDDSSQETLRHGLALGADRALLLKTNNRLESLNVAKVLAEVCSRENPQLVLMGKQAIDGDNNQTPQMLSALLDWPQATYASEIEWTAEGLRVTREVDGGLETIAVDLPAVLSTDLRLNEPRYASLPNIMKAKKKPLDVIDVSQMALNLRPHVEVLRVEAPPVRTGGVKVDSVDALLDKLKNEAKVL